MLLLQNTAFIQAALRGHMTRSRRIADDDAIVRLQSIARGHLTRRAVPRRGHDVNRKSISVSPPPSQRRASHSADRDKMRRSLSRSPLRVEVCNLESKLKLLFDFVITKYVFIWKFTIINIIYFMNIRKYFILLKIIFFIKTFYI